LNARIGLEEADEVGMLKEKEARFKRNGSKFLLVVLSEIKKYYVHNGFKVITDINHLSRYL